MNVLCYRARNYLPVLLIVFLFLGGAQSSQRGRVHRPELARHLTLVTDLTVRTDAGAVTLKFLLVNSGDQTVHIDTTVRPERCTLPWNLVLVRDGSIVTHEIESMVQLIQPRERSLPLRPGETLTDVVRFDKRLPPGHYDLVGLVPYGVYQDQDARSRRHMLMMPVPHLSFDILRYGKGK